MKLDRSHIDHVAKLASLSLTPEEAETLTAELGAILRHVEELATVDTSSVTAVFMPGAAASGAGAPLEQTAWRRDEVRPGLAHDEALGGAPRQADGGFAVPAFVEGGS